MLFRSLRHLCEIPTTIGSCPTGAIRPHPDKNLKSVIVNEERCMYCGNCYTMCPALPCFDSERGGVALLVGGKVSNARKPPMFSRLIVPYLPNNPPRWPEVVDAVKNARIYRLDDSLFRAGPRLMEAVRQLENVIYK